MATYREIQDWVKRRYGFVPKTCWIADVKAQCGLTVRRAPNRQGTQRLVPCPPGKIEAIKAAFRQFEIID